MVRCAAHRFGLADSQVVNPKRPNPTVSVKPGFAGLTIMLRFSRICSCGR